MVRKRIACLFISVVLTISGTVSGFCAEEITDESEAVDVLEECSLNAENNVDPLVINSVTALSSNAVDLSTLSGNVIVYVLNRGTNDSRNPESYSAGTNVKLFKPVREGYKFKGWYDSPSMTNRVRINKDTSGPVVAYAKWTPKKYPIKYVLKQSGTGKINNKTNPKKYEVSETTDVVLRDPTRTGYIFKGWFNNGAYAVSVNRIEKDTVGKVTVFAKWEPTEYKIKFDLNGEKGTIVGAKDIYKYDEKFKMPQVTGLVKKLKGWCTSDTGKGKIYKAGTTYSNIVKDGTEITLYAIYEEKKGYSTGNTESATEYEKEVLRLVNIERAKEGISPLEMDETLLNVAHIRSKEIKRKFSHFRPDGTKWDTALPSDHKYRTWGENIAYGQTTPKAVVEAWMNSEGHRKNIMNSNYNIIGVGCYKDEEGVYYWVQNFAGIDMAGK